MSRNGVHPDSQYANMKRNVARAKPPTPPYALNDEQMVVWNMIVSTRAPQEWSGIDEFFAADLSVATISLRDARMKLDDEGQTILGMRNLPILNPLVPAVTSLVAQTLRLSNRLRLSAQDVHAENGMSTASARKRMKEAEARDEVGEDDDVELLARPSLKPLRSTRPTNSAAN